MLKHLRRWTSPATTGQRPHDHAPRERASDAAAPGYWDSQLRLRVIITTCYLLLIPAGVLPMSHTWWIASAWTLEVYAVGVYGLFCWRGIGRLQVNVTPFCDTFFVMLATIAVARPDYPIWVGYLLIISSLSMLHTTRYLVAFSLWCIAVFWCGVAGAAVLDRGTVMWQMDMIVTAMAVFTALNSDMISTSNRKLRELVRQASMTDPLTGLDNRRRFREVLDAHAAADTRPLAVLMYDIDNFKALNDKHGHVSADGVLVRVAQQLQETFRDADTVARYGGDELVVLAHVDSLDDAVTMAQRSLQHIAEHTGVRMSAGVSVYPVTAPSLDAAVRDADDALGRAKQAGKARVSVAPFRPAA
jgi:diguanylate cyclase (GGDEF)-like protein